MRKRTYEASYTAKREICAALKNLMAQKPLNKITVAEIMSACGMARQHFYYHFEDVYDAVRWMFDEEALVLLREHEGVMLWQDGLLQLFQYLQENKAVCLCALRSIGREHLKHFFQTDIHTIIQSTIRSIAAERHYQAGEQELNMLTQFYVGALANIVEDWLLGEIQGSPEEIIRFVDQVLQDHVRGADLRMSETRTDEPFGQ
ncbi:TetR/AcrR family transcriptional regulator [Dysosmobacter sp.]|uniref:TetR/AcrR family transcriptional regulator n=1 Tax=Dysosmobacter sp. TaxID=2591382 RepID=UPI003A8F6788